MKIAPSSWCRRVGFWTKTLVGLLFLVWGMSLAAAAAPANPTPVRPAPPRPLPLLLLGPFTGEKLVVRARAVAVQGPVLQVELENGTRNAWDKAAFVATLPWYPDAELAGGAVDLPALGQVYERAQREHPGFAPGLQAEAARVRTVVAARDKERTQRVDAVLAAHDDPASADTVADLRRRLQAAEEVAAGAPERQAEIARAIAPLREHLANLETGRVFFAGEWRTVEDVRQRQAAAAAATRLQVLTDNLEIPFDTAILTADRLNRVLGVGALILGAPVLLGIFLLIRRRWLPGILTIVLPTALGALGVTALLSTDIAWPTAPGATDTGSESLRVLDAATAIPASGSGPETPVLNISDADANAFLARHVKLRGEPKPGAVNLRRVLVSFRPREVVFCQSAEWRGRTLLIRQVFDVQDCNGQPTVTAGNIRIGKASVPDPIKGWLRASLAPTVGEFLRAHDPRPVYPSVRFAAHSLELTPKLSPPVPVARTQPTPVPVLAETPTPTPAPAATSPPATPVPAMVAEETPEGPAGDPATPLLGPVGTAPGPDNSFYVYAIWDAINSASVGDIAKQMDRLHEQMGKGNRYHRLGFAFILGGNENQLRSICNLARQKNLAIGVILGAQTHSGAGKNEVSEDLRSVQWRLASDGWRGGSGRRDGMVPTPSRYCRLIRDALEKTQKQRCEMLKRVMDSFPGVITCIDGTIEEELADGGQTSDDQLADYSPFAVTEFRDWLRHTGEYDADHGKYAGQGAPERIVGSLVNVKGKSRSLFYSAATPDATSGGGSFNQRFGTSFKSWTLKYWDLQAFPGPITDESFHPMPESGKGFTDGGFDAPRRRGVDRWWQAWSWDYQDNGKRYPPGKPDEPSFGFRQALIHNFVVDMFGVALKARLPANLMFAHQLPGEVLTRERERSSASPVWTGYLPFSGTVGVTRFGFFDPELALRYTKSKPQSRGWGIFEWHPMPNADPNDPKLYRVASDHLQIYYRARAHHLFAGWWTAEPKEKRDFPLADSQFAKAIKDFMDSRADQPYPGTPR